ncbi:MAG: 4Fe-4S ferredoxin [Deltaproteobacteria bacterium]|nr:MAG: 4Fe-4S ferredoxin [Deltaproteobacteria bacterium]
MDAYTDKIREISKKLLSDGTVDIVVGFRKGSLGYMSEPYIARTEEAAEELVFDCNCRMNLANYITGKSGKIGIVAKGCDSRNITTHIVENKIRRDQLYIIGVPCTGMADKNALLKLAEGDIQSVEDDSETITIKGEGFEKKVAKSEILQANCKTCIRRNPVIYDELVADEVPELELTDRFSDVEKIESMDVDKRWKFFTELLSECTRCYACRNACPLCYCPTCFVDESKPQWVGKGEDPIDVKTYHFLRAFHDAGRCTDCGACESACPMDIKMRYFTRKSIKDCVEKYGWESGMDIEQRPALDQFNLDDPNDFIR